MINYEQIQKVNEELTGIDVKGKNYVMVPQRVTAFRKLFPDGFIRTKLLSLEDGVCVMQAEVGAFIDDGHNEIVLATGMAYEKETSSYINKTSYIENCETSAVGRALGFLGLGIEGGGICSAEELMNAISNQDKKVTKDAPATVAKVGRIPETASDYIKNEIIRIQEKMQIESYAEAKATVLTWIDMLVKSEKIKPVDYAKITLDEAKAVFKEVREAFVSDRK